MATIENNTGKRAATWLRDVATMLEKKGQAYGNSVGDPLRIFSKAGVTEGIRVRIDDKLSRIARGNSNDNEDVLKDLCGYVALLAVCEQDAPGPVPETKPCQILELSMNPVRKLASYYIGRWKWRYLNHRQFTVFAADLDDWSRGGQGTVWYVYDGEKIPSNPRDAKGFSIAHLDDPVRGADKLV